MINIQKEQLKALCKGVGIPYEEPSEIARENMIEMEIDDMIEEKHQDSDENFEGEKNIGWGMNGE